MASQQTTQDNKQAAQTEDHEHYSATFSFEKFPKY